MTEQTPLAIIGMACRLPGAGGPEEFWDLLLQGRSAIGELPPERLDVGLYYDPARGVAGKTYSKIAGLCDYPAVDRAKYPIPEDLLEACDVAHLAGCQVAIDACRDAGFDPLDLPHRNSGVFIGHTRGSELGGDLVYSTMIEQAAAYLREVGAFERLPESDRNEILKELVETVRARLPRRGPGGGPNTSPHMAASVISRTLRLDGPSIVLNSACASSLDSLLVARRALERGEIEMAIIGGVTCLKRDNFILYSYAQSISATGSRPFDDTADGLVPSDGYAMLLVKTLDRAVADGNRVLGVVRGIGVSSDGRGKSLWAPKKEGRVKAIQRAYAGGLDASRLQFVETHATSTRVGDAVEMAALVESLASRLPAGARIPVGSVKANIGHTLEAAGAASLIKLLLAMRHETVPRQINFHRLNTQIDWDRSPFFVPTADVPWPRPANGGPRRAAVNAFGIGGLNAHVVLDEHVEPRRTTVPTAVAAPPARPARGDRKRDDDAVAVIGAACIFPGALCLEAFWDLLISGRDPKCDAPPDRRHAGPTFESGSARPCRSPANRGGFVTGFAYDWRRHKVPPVQVARANPLQFMILDAVDAALRDAGCEVASLDRSRVGVIVGTQGGSDFLNELQMGLRLSEFRRDLAEALRRRGVPPSEIAAIAEAYSKVLLDHMPALLDDSGSFSTSTLASRIAKVYDFMGGAMAIDAGEASSLAAIWCAMGALVDHACDLVVCAAGQRMMGLPAFEQMSLAGELAADAPRAPFDARAAGRLPGEGVGVLLLKRLADAKQSGLRIRAILRGAGAGFVVGQVSNLPCGVSVPACPRSGGTSGDARPTEHVLSAIRRALESAGVDPADVVLLETAGSGSPERDRGELAAVGDAYGAHPRRRPLLLGSAAAQIGHAMGASGMASLLKAGLSLEHRRVPAVFGADGPLPDLLNNGATALPAAEGSPLTPARSDGRLFAAVHSCDPAGGAFHVVLEAAEPAPVPDEVSIGIPGPISV